MNRIKLGELLKVKHGYAFKSENYVPNSPYALVTLANISGSNNYDPLPRAAQLLEREMPQLRRGGYIPARAIQDCKKLT